MYLALQIIQIFMALREFADKGRTNQVNVLICYEERIRRMYVHQAQYSDSLCLICQTSKQVNILEQPCDSNHSSNRGIRRLRVQLTKDGKEKLIGPTSFQNVGICWPITVSHVLFLGRSI